MQEEIKKLYYSISEVSEKTELKQYVLRYWESEFDQLKPIKNRSGNRIYTDEDIAMILQIKKLLYEEKFTVEGAKRRLTELEEQGTIKNTGAENLVKEIRDELNEALKKLI